MEFVVVGLVVTVGLTTDVGDVVFVVGVVDVLFVIAGVVTFGVVVVVFVVGVVVLDVSVVLGTVVVGVVLVVKVDFGVNVVFGTLLVFVVKDAGGLVAVGTVVFGDVIVEVTPVDGLGATEVPAGPLGRAPEPSEVIEPDGRPVNEGRSLKSRMTLPNGARSSPLASGICLLDVRFFRIAIFYPLFFSNEVNPAMLVTGVSFTLLASVFAGVTGAAF